MNAQIRSSTSRRSGVALLLTLLLLILTASALTQMVTLVMSESVRSGRTDATLQHRLAAESMVHWTAWALTHEAELAHEFGDTGRVSFTRSFGSIETQCQIVNDAAKLNIAQIAAPSDRRSIMSNLRKLEQRLDLPAISIDSEPISLRKRRQLRRDGLQTAAIAWPEQLLKGDEFGTLFALPTREASVDTPCWSDLVTVYGDGRVDLRHADPELLQLVIEDINYSAARRLRSARKRGDDLRQAIGDLKGLSNKHRDALEQRTAFDSDRYALTIETAYGNDRRRWYLVADFDRGRISYVYFWEQIRW